MVEELEQSIPDNVILYGDAEKRVYGAFGLGELGWDGVINRSVLKQVGDLKKEGISNRLTRGTRCEQLALKSRSVTVNNGLILRWQTNGGFAIDEGGIVRYVHVGRDSGDITDLQAAIKSVS